MRPLRAAPSDVEDPPEEDLDPAAEDENDDDAGLGGEGDEGTGGEGESDEDPAALKAAEQRRKIEQRATERREENERIARETARATATETARIGEQATARANAEREEREALAAMTDDQKVQYQLAKQVKGTQDGLSQVRALTQSSTDSAKFDRMLTRKPQFEKFSDEVEKRHQNSLNQGYFTPREAILAHLIGENALKATNVGKQKEAAGRRVAAARGTSGRGARGDTTGRGNTGKSIVEKAEAADWAI